MHYVVPGPVIWTGENALMYFELRRAVYELVWEKDLDFCSNDSCRSGSVMWVVGNGWGDCNILYFETMRSVYFV